MTVADWNKPDLNSTKASWLNEARLLANHAIIMDPQGDSNLPSGAKRFNGNTQAFESYNGSTWSRLYPLAGTIEMFFVGGSLPPGYLPLDGSTIGDGSSGASYASANYLELFTTLWINLGNAYATVSGGRGASAAADFAAHKTMTLPDMRQRMPMGLSSGGTGATLGSTGGSVDHTHDLGAHTHGAGTLRADVGTNPGTNENIFFSLDGASTFSSSYKYSVATSSLSSNTTTVASVTTHGNTGTPSTNLTSANNQAFMVVHFFIHI